MAKRVRKCAYCAGSGKEDPKAEARAKRAEDVTRNNTWKALEKDVAKVLRGKRVSRGSNWGFSTVDIRVKDIPLLKIDCKKRKNHAGHSLMREIERKYCTKPGDLPLLVTKEYGPSPMYAAVPLALFADLLEVTRAYAKVNGVTRRLTSKRLARLIAKAKEDIGVGALLEAHDHVPQSLVRGRKKDR